MNSFIGLISSLASPWLYIVVAVLAAAESAALVGLVVPGEVALLFAGWAAAQGRVSLLSMVIIATTAAIAGDSIGYEIGRHFGPWIRTSRAGLRIGEARWVRSEAFIERRGGSAVLLGRWVGFLRAMVPGIAGMTRMPYRKFLLWNVLGAIIWAPAIVIAGFLAGNSFLVVEHWLGRASLATGAVVAIVSVWVGTRHARDQQDPAAPPTP